MSKVPVIICDIDGTAAKMTGRSPYDYTKVSSDVPNEPVRTVLCMLHKCGYKVLYVSGREGSAQVRQDTEHWLLRHSFPRGPLYMRPEGDYRPDDVVKMEIYEDDIAPDYDVFVVFDDRNRVVDMWRDLGLTCFQVAEGDF